MLRTHAAPLIAVLLASACTSHDTSDAALIASAERVRRLAFVVVPPIDHQTPEEYAKTSAADAAAMTDDRVAELRGVFGRLGYFSSEVDVRAATANAASFFGGFYFEETKRITVIGHEAPALFVHELVHALQDQHFDLTAFKEGAHTTDEALARKAVIEGDARLAELWYQNERVKPSPEAFLASWIFPDYAEATADLTWSRLGGPKVFTARSAFVYGYGAQYVAQRMGMPTAPFHAALDFGARDAAFRDPPRSTQEILAGRREDDPIVDVGLRGLPRSVSTTYAISAVDRLGEWYMRVLDASSETAMLPALASPDEPAPPTFAPEAWDGDQLAVLAARGADGKAAGPPLAVVWTSAWDTPEAAAGFARLLARVHAVAATDAGRWEGPAADGEHTHLRVEGDRVVFVKNLDDEAARDVADAALGHLPSQAFTTLTQRSLATMQRLP